MDPAGGDILGNEIFYPLTINHWRVKFGIYGAFTVSICRQNMSIPASKCGSTLVVGAHLFLSSRRRFSYCWIEPPTVGYVS